jgi:hypothetical protein
LKQRNTNHVATLSETNLRRAYLTDTIVRSLAHLSPFARINDTLFMLSGWLLASQNQWMLNSSARPQYGTAIYGKSSRINRLARTVLANQ